LSKEALVLLLIPGPVTTHPEVRAALAQDFAPWDNDFRPIYAGVRERVLRIAGGREGEHITLVLQGCGHFMVEAAIRTLIPVDGPLLVANTGAYAQRMIRLAREAGRQVTSFDVPQDRPIRVSDLTAALEANPGIGHLGLVYSETGTGIVHDVPALAQAAGRFGRRVLVDAVSAFGAMPFSIGELPMVDAVIFTSNKCIEGAPGLAFAVSPVARLDACVGNAGSWSFDLVDLLAQTRRSGPGSFRFTPPAQVLVAFDKALDIYEREGGQPARLARYRTNMRILYEGVRALGLVPCLSPEAQGPIVINVHAPADPAWDLQRFVDALKRRGVLISNFYNTPAPSMRLGCIGAISPEQMRGAVTAIGEALAEIGVRQVAPKAA
jgi:2-aminoethylphosphonate-pyruvate transaminase